MEKERKLPLIVEEMEQCLSITDTDEGIAEALERKYGKEARNIVAGLL